METYLEIAIGAPEQQREILIAAMVELGCEGFQETESELLCYVKRGRLRGEAYERFQAELRALLAMFSSNATLRFREIADENWNEQWERTIQPIEVGQRFVVKPSWAHYDNVGGRIVLEIDPKMSFGTGYHETTRLMLLLMERYLHPGGSVLDVGTGTGILAIAALKLGARSAVGIDNDPWSIENAEENVAANAVSVTISAAPLTACASSSMGMIAANLTLNTNLSMLGEFRRILSPGGLLLLSGLLLHDEAAMTDGLRRQGFLPVDRLVEHEWIALVASSPG
jgi:ribosomal protein L11 methyltransferase